MGLKVTGVSQVAHRLENLHEGRVTDRPRLAMRNGAYAVRNLARQQAPFLEGTLEKAIKVDEDRGGINRRKRFTIYVDESMSVPGRPGKSVGDYAVEMHEGTYKHGKGTNEKQAANPGVKVGRKYLERAVDELSDDIIKQVTKALQSAL